MSYYTHCWGRINISPPLTWGEIRASPFLEGHSSRPWLVLVIETDHLDTEQGPLERRQAVALEPSDRDDLRVDDPEATLAKFLAFHGMEGQTFSGTIHGEGEDNADMWRLSVKNGRAHYVKAQIVWPDEEEET